VTIGTGTSVTTTAKATAKALKVQECVSAQGTADTTGAVTATRIAISPAINGTCSTGFGVRNGG
jgi:hypothetical protein